jgi:hypothetical protein
VGTYADTNNNTQGLLERFGGVGPQGNIFASTFERCTILHVGYNRFVNGTVVHWRVTSNGVGMVASGQFNAIGGGVL